MSFDLYLTSMPHSWPYTKGHHRNSCKKRKGKKCNNFLVLTSCWP